MTTLSSNQAKAGPSTPEFIALIALITSLVALSIDAMLPALPNIADDLGVTDFRQTQWVITALILGDVFWSVVIWTVVRFLWSKVWHFVGYCTVLYWRFGFNDCNQFNDVTHRASHTGSGSFGS